MPTTVTTTPAPAKQSRSRAGKRLAKWFWQGGTVLALILLIAFFTAMRPDVFLSIGNIRNIFEQVAILTIIAAGQTVVMVVGDFDLSVGTNATLSGAVAAALMIAGVPVPLAIVAGLAVGVLVGVVNGLLVAVLKLSAFVATLATMTTVGGLAFIVTAGSTLYDMPSSFFTLGQGRLFGIPLPVIFAVIAAAIVWVLLRFTTPGRRLYAVGGNAEVARLSGVNVRRTRFLAFVVAGFAAAVGGIILVSRLGSASSGGANNYMMLAIAAVFLGMTVLKSGQANMGGTLVGVGIIGVMNNGLNIIGVDTYYQQVLTGLIIIGAVTLSALKARES